MNLSVACALHITCTQAEREAAHQQRTRLLPGTSRLLRIC
tara:strand:+ start:52 stop:171 length:120 start_codon:yes stop_codon:yes gene_type:complete